MADFLTTAFPVILVLVASSKEGQEVRVNLPVFPEFKLYNLSLWRVRGKECVPHSVHFVKSKDVYVEVSKLELLRD